ncbi:MULTISPECIES: 30S ribosomal protein S6 [Kordiimonas]|jgi:small subunit ribosomal protein S6|uniref:Small ribosomal subunit protein bS6 n=1 Tax=Kordiimonas lacus TaxID=637679 RepID=A0A1G6WYT5_9PROT|nr:MULTISPECIES: 30S ribosomal protein S6 [Kordiimonas]SDD70165.1 small subunit ribosomal protein S6 [Kordiimonas lacus]
MAFYEHVFIARQDITASQVEGITADFSKIVEENEGKVAKTEYWGLKNLAYKIKKNRKGHYILMNIDAPHAAVAEMERQARLHDDVLRFMTIRVDELEEGQSIVLRSKADKERRGPRGEGRGEGRGDNRGEGRGDKRESR